MEVQAFNAASPNGSGAEVTFVSTFQPSSRTHDVLDGLAVLSMAGVAAEVVACGNAEGGYTDVGQLRALMALATPPIVSSSEQDDRVRWATLMALTLLQNNRQLLDKLARLFEDGVEDVGTCIRTLEASGAE
eukprot:7380172-Prymnesium_polylepis.1